MGVVELFLIAVGLSMDAFAVAMVTGLSMKKANFKKAAAVGLYFGGFQGIMPFIGYLAASRFSDYVVRYDHWTAFILLSIIGGKMVWESFKKEGGSDEALTKETLIIPRVMLPLALATSIDAMAVGISFAFLQISIVYAVLFIGTTTFVLSSVGVVAGKAFGRRLKNKAELFGGLILVAMGTKILLEHTGIIGV